MTAGMQNVTTACPKDKMELNFFLSLLVLFTKTILKVLRSSSIGEWRESKSLLSPWRHLLAVSTPINLVSCPLQTRVVKNTQ